MSEAMVRIAEATRYAREIRDLTASLASLDSTREAFDWGPEIIAIRARLRILLGIEEDQ